MYFFWRKDNIFLEPERRDGLSTVPTYNWQNVPERSCANDDVICVITSAIGDNYMLIEQLTFQSAAAQFRLVVKVRAPYLLPLSRYYSRSREGLRSRALCVLPM
jgi:hypothetical protein